MNGKEPRTSSAASTAQIELLEVGDEERLGANARQLTHENDEHVERVVGVVGAEAHDARERLNGVADAEVEEVAEGDVEPRVGDHADEDGGQEGEREVGDDHLDEEEHRRDVLIEAGGGQQERERDRVRQEERHDGAEDERLALVEHTTGRVRGVRLIGERARVGDEAGHESGERLHEPGEPVDGGACAHQLHGLLHARALLFQHEPHRGQDRIEEADHVEQQKGRLGVVQQLEEVAARVGRIGKATQLDVHLGGRPCRLLAVISMRRIHARHDFDESHVDRLLNVQKAAAVVVLLMIFTMTKMSFDPFVCLCVWIVGSVYRARRHIGSRRSSGRRPQSAALDRTCPTR